EGIESRRSSGDLVDATVPADGNHRRRDRGHRRLSGEVVQGGSRARVRLATIAVPRTVFESLSLSGGPEGPHYITFKGSPSRLSVTRGANRARATWRTSRRVHARSAAGARASR